MILCCAARCVRRAVLRFRRMLFDPLVLIQQPLAVLGTLAIIIFGKSLAAYFWCACLVTPNARRSPLPPASAQIGEFAFIPAGLGMA